MRIARCLMISIVVACLLTNCAAPSQTAPAVQQQPPMATPASQSTPATSDDSGAGGTTVASLPGGTLTATATDGQGDAASIQFQFGSAAPLDTLGIATACTSALDQDSAAADRSVAIPLTVTGTLTSSLDADVSVNVGGVGLVGTDGSFDANGEDSLSSYPVWAATYDNGTSCAVTDGGYSAGSVSWKEMAPGAAQTWNAWLILPNVISPDDPSARDYVDRVVMAPSVTLADDDFARLTFPLAQSPGLVYCDAADPAAGRLAYDAVDAGAAETDGCARPVNAPAVRSSPTPASDAACVRAYLGSTSRTFSIKGGSATLYDRQASELHVCEGFGYPHGLTLTAGMQCALVGAMATYAGPEAEVGVDRLCDASTIAEAYQSGDWIGAASGEAKDRICGYLGEAFAGGTALFAASATSETGPGAVAIGVATYRAFDAAAKVACGGLFDGGATSLGNYIENKREATAAARVIRDRECLEFRSQSGFAGSSWHAVPCHG